MMEIDCYFTLKTYGKTIQLATEKEEKCQNQMAM